MKIETIYKHFLIIPVTHLPVVAEDETFLGLLAKEKVIIDMADLSLQDQEYDKIPEHLLDFNISESIIYYFQKNRTIPVLNILAQKIGSWEKPRFLAEVSTLTHKEFPEEEINAEEEPEEQSTTEDDNSDVRQTIIRYIEMVLENFPDPLFATDKEGKTTFYNEFFEKHILTIPFFKDSISFAEKYFRDLNRDLISHYLQLQEDEQSSEKIPTLQVFVQNLNKSVRVITLREKNRVQGFLYHILESPQNNNNSIKKFPSIEEAFRKKMPLNEILKEIEIHYIYHCLQENKNNISHTANQLEIPRSTLQNRIKQLNIQKHFPELAETPIQRGRKTREKNKTKEKKIDSKKNIQKDLLKSSSDFIIELSLSNTQSEPLPENLVGSTQDKEIINKASRETELEKSSISTSTKSSNVKKTLNSK
ncbi:MAG: helix-turn-helix domain-containing protein [Spirochaetota bacterium]